MEFSPSWRVVLDTAHAEFKAPTFTVAAGLVAAIGAAADAAQHHPDLVLRYPGIVRVALTTHASGGLTDLDVQLARTIDELAARHHTEPLPVSTATMTIAIDTLDADRIRPFWQAVLGLRADGDALSDPARALPTVWFQQMDAPRPERNRIHLDLYVPTDQAEQRVRDTVAAGGVLVTDQYAPSWWVLADADGNEVCVCTSTQSP